MARVDVARLREIEEIAGGARSQAEAQMAELGVQAARCTDVRYLATLIAYGDVQAVPNLTYDGERLAGCLEWLPVGANIFYEAYDPRVRQRFSVAHEVGHFLLHVDVLRSEGPIHADLDSSVDTGDAEDTTEAAPRAIWEVEADAFAAAFLIPMERLQADLSHFGYAPSFLAERYGVSEKAMGRRLRSIEVLLT